MAIFLTQMGVNFLHVMRTGRPQRRQAMELQFPQPLPPQNRLRDLEVNPNARRDAGRGEDEGLPAPGLAHDNT